MLVYLVIGFNLNINIYDEGIVLVGAARVAGGAVPYRDFWSIYGPGQFHLLALLFRLFGVSILVVRVASVATWFLLGWIVFRTGLRLLSPALATVVALAAVIQVDFFGFHGAPVPTAVLLAMASSYFLVAYLQTRRPRHLLSCGLLLGLVPVFRHDIGGYTLAAQVLVLVPYLLAGTPEKLSGIRTRAAGHFGRYVLGTSVSFLPVFAYYLITVTPGVLYDTLIRFPATIFPGVRELPYPPLFPPGLFDRPLLEALHHFQFYVPFLVWLLVLIQIAVAVRRRGRKTLLTTGLWVRLYFLLLAVFFFGQAAVRSDIYHLLPTMIPVLMLLGLLVHEHDGSLTGWAGRVVQITVAVSLVCSVGYPIEQKLEDSGRDLRGLATVFTHEAPEGMHAFGLDRAKGIFGFPHFTHYETVIATVQSITRPDEPVFVGNVFHDRIFVNDVMFYYLLDRPVPTRYHELHPGLADTPEVQREIIEELESLPVRYVVLWYAPEHFHTEPNDSMKSTGVTLLDTYIRETYQRIGGRQWDYGIYRRREAGAQNQL